MLAVGLLASACGRPRAGTDVAGGPSTTSADLQRLDLALDRLEQRLLASQADVALWTELHGRHEDVSAIACRNLAEHARAVALFDERQHEKRSPLRRNRVATRFDPTAENRR